MVLTDATDLAREKGISWPSARQLAVPAEGVAHAAVLALPTHDHGISVFIVDRQPPRRDGVRRGVARRRDAGSVVHDRRWLRLVHFWRRDEEWEETRSRGGGGGGRDDGEERVAAGEGSGRVGLRTGNGRWIG
jgi:hypothetical protein